MTRKECMAVVAAGLLLFSAASLPEGAEAAIGGGRAPRMTTPRMNTPRPQAPRTNTPPAAQNRRPNQEYRPSQRAADIPSRAPSASARTGNTASVPVNGTRWGNAMRNVGLLAGGMMLGGLLGRMFGFGAGGFMADMLGLLVNVALAFCAVRLLSRAWRAFREGAGAAGHETPFPVTETRPRVFPARDNGGTDYEPGRTAEWYRGR